VSGSREAAGCASQQEIGIAASKAQLLLSAPTVSSILLFDCTMWHCRVTFALLFCAVMALAGCRSVEKTVAPSNFRDWEPVYAKLPTAEFEGDTVHVKNIRYCKYLDSESYIVDHYDRTFDVKDIRAVDFFVMPFIGMPALAHTQVSFEIVDPPRRPEYLAVSVETRKEKGEAYDPLKGSTRQYELIYVLADERDTLHAQAMRENQQIYRYRSTATPEVAQELFVDIIARVNKLAEQPEFYDTFTNNCTTNIVSHINRVVPHRVVYDYRILLPGLSDQLAYEAGLIEKQGSFLQTKNAARVNERIETYAGHRDFSQLIRR
jgi:hypothetical protein